MARQKWRLHWGPLRGLSLTWLYLVLCAITCLKSKIKDGNTCIYVSFLLLPPFLKCEWWDKSYTPTWVKYKIGRGKIIVTYQEHSWALFTCDITVLGEGLTKVVVLLTWAFVLTLLLSMWVSVETVNFSNL